MELTPTQILRMSGEALARFIQNAPDSEIRLTPGGSLVLSGEPVADLNYAFIHAKSSAEEKLREYAQVLDARGLPCIIILSQSVSVQLESVATELGLESGGSVPLMACNTTGLNSEPHGFQFEMVKKDSELQKAYDVFAKSFSLPKESVTRINNEKLLSTPGTNTFILRQRNEII